MTGSGSRNKMLVYSTMIVAPVKIAVAKKAWAKPAVRESRLGFEVSAYSGSQWVKPVAVDSRLGFEVTAYSGSQWVKPVAIDTRLGFEVTAYAGSK